MRLLLIAITALFGAAAAILAGSDKAVAADLAYFYCYAPNPETGTTYVSDVHAVGPVSERGRYGEEFAGYLASKGKMRAGGVGYCVMRATIREVERGRTEMTRMTCSECGGAEKLEDVRWPRAGNSLEAVLVGNGPGSSGRPLAVPAEDQESAEPAQPGLTLYVREDETDAVYVANQPGGADLARRRTEERGGRWRALKIDDQCGGWGSVAVAESAGERRYWSQGGDTEAAAEQRALHIARLYAAGKGAGWTARTLATYFNSIQPPEPSLIDQAIDSAKQFVRDRVVDQCAEGDGGSSRSTRFACMCVRG